MQRTHHGVPETSLLANEATDKEKLKIRIINALYSMGGCGNSEQIEKAIADPNVTSVDVSRRMSELEREERVLATPYALKNDNNRLCTLYRLPHVTQITINLSPDYLKTA